jgi:hypothetical protein
VVSHQMKQITITVTENDDGKYVVDITAGNNVLTESQNTMAGVRAEIDNFLESLKRPADPLQTKLPLKGEQK